jgi:uncharacterized protein YcfL
MKNFLIILFLSFLTVVACKSNSSESQLEELKSKAITLHDEVMPKTMKISEIKKQVLEKADTQDAAIKDVAQNINAKLQAAEDLMYSWMDELGVAMNTEGDDAVKLKAYQGLVKSVEKIKSDTNGALKEADEFIKEVKK